MDNGDDSIPVTIEKDNIDVATNVTHDSVEKETPQNAKG